MPYEKMDSDSYEKKHELNIGADMGFINDRINLGIDVYKRNNYDMIGKTTTMGVGGVVDKMANVAEMKAHGVEVSLSTTNINLKNFRSTLVNLIPRFYDAAPGQVLVDGTDVKDYSLDTLRRCV